MSENSIFGKCETLKRLLYSTFDYQILALFTICAATSRYIFRETETRIQVAAFIALSIIVEVAVKPRLGRRPGWQGAVLGVVFATFAILAVRWEIEGLCGHYRQARCIPGPAAVGSLFAHFHMMRSNLR